MRRAHTETIYTGNPIDGSTFIMATQGWNVTLYFLVSLLVVQCYGQSDDDQDATFITSRNAADDTSPLIQEIIGYVYSVNIIHRKRRKSYYSVYGLGVKGVCRSSKNGYFRRIIM
jgi:hypothetical protein